MVFGTVSLMLARHGRSGQRRRERGRCYCAWSRVGHLLGCILRIELYEVSNLASCDGKGNLLLYPASPEKAIKVCLFNALVLSSVALRIVAPLMAALEAAMRVKSLPVMPSKTSLYHISSGST